MYKCERIFIKDDMMSDQSYTNEAMPSYDVAPDATR